MNQYVLKIYRHIILEAVNKAFIVLIPPAACAFLLRILGAKIGKNCRIYTPLIFTNTNFSNLQVGNNCHIGRDVMLDTMEPITLGNHVIISMRCTIITHFKMAIPSLERLGYETKYEGIEIGDNVYIGAGTTILHGVTIGENSVIGACSLVKEDVPANSLVAGVPAKVVRPLQN